MGDMDMGDMGDMGDDNDSDDSDDDGEFPLCSSVTEMVECIGYRNIDYSISITFSLSYFDGNLYVICRFVLLISFVVSCRTRGVKARKKRR